MDDESKELNKLNPPEIQGESVDSTQNSLDIANDLESLLNPNLESKNRESEELNSDVGTDNNSTIFIKEIALRKMFIMAQEISILYQQPLEVYSLSIGQNGVIEDILIPPQQVSYTSISISPEDIISIIPDIRDKKLNVLGWNHSHANFSVFFSSTDDRNQLTLLHETQNYKFLNHQRVKYCYGMTVNMNENLFGVVSTQLEDGTINHNHAKFDILDRLPDDFDDSDLRQQIHQRLKKVARTFHSSRFWQAPNQNEDFNEIKEENKTKNQIEKSKYHFVDKFLKQESITSEEIKFTLQKFWDFLEKPENTEDLCEPNKEVNDT